MIFDRRTYLDELISNEGNGMIKIVTGIRRCGKSFLLFTLYKQNLLERGVPSDHIIEIIWRIAGTRNGAILIIC